MQTTSPQDDIQEVWVRILKKGLITLPKAMRENAGIKESDIAKAKLVGDTIVIEPREETKYRIYTKEQIEQWKKDDELPPELAKKAEKFIKETFPDMP